MKQLFTLAFLFFIGASAHAQFGGCEPDPMFQDSTIGVYPAPYEPDTNPEGGITDTACLNTPFAFVFNVKIDSTISFGGTMLTIDSLVLDGVDNLPIGMTYTCNVDRCVFPKNSVSCVTIYGEATSENEAGPYSLVIRGKAYTGGIPIDITFPNPLIAVGEYILNVKEEGDGSCSVSGNDEINGFPFSWKAMPNPFSQTTDIVVETELAGRYNFRVYDLVGKALHQQNVNLQIGENRVHFDGSDLPKGIYLFTFEKDGQVFSDKLIKQ